MMHHDLLCRKILPRKLMHPGGTDSGSSHTLIISRNAMVFEQRRKKLTN
jgi:hypothetical protein